MSSRARFLSLSTLAALMLGACSSDEPARMEVAEANSPGGEMRPENLQSGRIAAEWRMASPQIRRPFAVHALDDSLLLVLDHAHPFMHLMNSRTGEYLFPLVARGPDAIEPFPVHRIAPSPHDANEFVAYSLIDGTLTAFRIGDAESPLVQLRAIRLQSVEAIDAPVWHDNNSITVEPVSAGHLRAAVSATGELLNPGGIALGDLAPQWVPASTWRAALEGQTCPHPNGNLLARTFQYMGRVMILDSAGNAAAEAMDTSYFDPQFIVHETGEVVFGAQGNGLRVAYLSCGVTSERIFSLFSGRTAARTQRSSGIVADQVHVHDWRGRLLGGFRIDRNAISLDVTPDGLRLLVIEGPPGTSISSYEVPRRFRGR